MKTGLLFLSVILVLSSCSTMLKHERILSAEEIKKYNLNGILREAEICPNRFDENLKQLVVDGPCEIVICDIPDGKTVCRARLK